jgi:threonine/homoserine/homoserine lactone efflux protein
MLTLAIGWFSTVAFLFSLSPVTRAYRKVKRGVDAVTGFIFIALAGRLATE